METQPLLSTQPQPQPQQEAVTPNEQIEQQEAVATVTATLNATATESTAEYDLQTMRGWPAWWYDWLIGTIMTRGKEREQRQALLDLVLPAVAAPEESSSQTTTQTTTTTDTQQQQQQQEPPALPLAVLDLGCGTGTLALLAAQRLGAGGRVVGIDPNPRFVQRARDKAQTQTATAAASATATATAALGNTRNVTVTFRHGHAHALPTEFTDAFDAVLCTLVWHHLPNHAAYRHAVLQQVYRVLKKNKGGGRFLLVDFVQSLSSSSSSDHEPDDDETLTEDEQSNKNHPHRHHPCACCVWWCQVFTKLLLGWICPRQQDDDPEQDGSGLALVQDVTQLPLYQQLRDVGFANVEAHAATLMNVGPTMALVATTD